METMGELHKIFYTSNVSVVVPLILMITKQKLSWTKLVMPSILVVRGLAEKMIESFMLAANETVAEHYNKAKAPFIYRVHETPDGERVASFFEFLTAFWYQCKGA